MQENWSEVREREEREREQDILGPGTE